MGPDIENAARSQTGNLDSLTRSRARVLAVKAFEHYDPERGTKLRSHIHNYMRGLLRYTGQMSSGVSVPERLALDRRTVSDATGELTAELGREPNDDELADRTGFSMERLRRIRKAMPAMAEGFFASRTREEGGDEFAPAVNGDGGPSQAWMTAVYDDLSAMDKKVFEWSLGWNGQPKLDGMAIASRLRRSPGWVSQRRLYIQKVLDREQELSPF
jgi:hypothetical protein